MGDRRLWVKVSTDIGRHPKFSGLSDAAFRAWIEALAHAKELNKDGFIPLRDARRWMPELEELLTNDPDRPSMVRVDGGFQIHDYTHHQESAERVESRRRASVENGRKGGRPPKPRNLETNLGAKAESRVQSPEISKTSKSQSLDTRASGSTDSEAAPMTLRLAGQAGITSLAGVAKQTLTHTGRIVDPNGAYRLSLHLLGKAKRHPSNPQRYVMACIRDSAFEVQQFIDEEGL